MGFGRALRTALSLVRFVLLWELISPQRQRQADVLVDAQLEQRQWLFREETSMEVIGQTT
jgi:hypothetical protein